MTSLFFKVFNVIHYFYDLFLKAVLPLRAVHIADINEKEKSCCSQINNIASIILVPKLYTRLVEVQSI